MTSQIEFPCGTVVPGCEFVVHGKSKAEVLAKLAEHSREAHGVERLSDNLKNKILSTIESA